MVRRLTLIGAGMALLVQVGATMSTPGQPAGGAAFRFPDAAMPPTSGWTGPVFRLSQDYPAKAPAPEIPPWSTIDFRTHPLDYARTVLRYGLEGNDAVDWAGQDNKVRKWYHAPWLHYGRNGREFIHGLTHERVSEPGELGPAQTARAQNWAVGLYNAPGGYVVGQVWKDPNAPNPSAARFPNGTVSIKLLFTHASVDQAPYLRNAKEWDAYIYRDIVTPTNPRLPRVVAKLRLLQIDIAVRDTRADATTGWVFGTFVYNGDAHGATVWERMIPVGLSWGNDPAVTAADINRGAKKLVESSINTRSDLPLFSVQAPRQHLGWAGRLNGPVDNPMSSCLSCHSTAQWPTLSPILPPSSAPPGGPAWMRWFRNVKTGEAFDSGAVSLDYSLQLGSGIANFFEWRQLVTTMGGSNNAPRPPKPGFRLHSLDPNQADREIFPVSRDEKDSQWPER